MLLNHQYLVSGFIRKSLHCVIRELCGNVGSLEMAAVSAVSTVKLIGMFYYRSNHLLLMSGSTESQNTKHNQLHILGLHDLKRYKIKLNPLEKVNAKKGI